MPFTNSEQAAMRYYLGRPDYPRFGPCMEWQDLQQAITQVSLDGEEKIRAMIALLEDIDTKIAAALNCLTVEKVDGATLRAPGYVHNTLRAEGRRLAQQLARYLGVGITNTPWGPVGLHANMTHRG